MRRRPSIHKLNTTQRIVMIVFVLVALAIAGIGDLKKWLAERSGGQPPAPPRPPATRLAEEGYPHLLLGNPSGATGDADNRNNYLMKKPGFALSYNNAKGTPNWVSWRLGKDDLGDAPRGQFYPDPDLPPGFIRVTPRDYTGSGFDRGHMCPHSDRDKTAESSRATFAMTNIVPQSPTLNQTPWNLLEQYCRDLVEKRGKELYIICGPHGRGGEGSSGPMTTLGGRNTVTVPESCWKVILVLDDAPGDDLARVGPNTRLIAVSMPNRMNLNSNWAGFRVPVKTIEKLTGYKFFDRVPELAIAPLKAQADRERIPQARTPRRAEGSE